jgi:hypothetical protein
MSKRYAPMAVAANHGWVFTIRRNLADLVRMAVRLLRGGHSNDLRETPSGSTH